MNGCRHLAYIDVNNLYGSSLSKPLPHSDFKWLTEDELENFKLEENYKSGRFESQIWKGHPDL